MTIANHSLDQRISWLKTEIEDGLRSELYGALRALRDLNNVPICILITSRMLEGKRGLLGVIAALSGLRFEHSTLEKQIEALSVINKIVPPEVASDMHWIRVRSNKARHNSEKSELTLNDAEMALDRTLRIIEWYYCEFEFGKRLQSIYDTNHRAITLQERFSELQQATDEQTQFLQAQISLLQEELRLRENPAESKREAIPLPLPNLRGTFVDRETERDTLRYLLCKSETGLVVIVAPGGYGKTELTTKFLKEIAPQAKITGADVQGILYLRCVHGEISVGRIFSEAGRISGNREKFQQVYASRELSLEQKLEFFFSELSQTGNVWLVMDNFEDLLDKDDRIDSEELKGFIEGFLSISHKVRLIITTRAMPRFAGSQRLKPIDLRSGLPEDKAVEYLQTEGAEFGLQEVETGLLINFVNRLHRVPKALESVIGYLYEKYPVIQLQDLMENDSLFADFDNYDTENGLKRLIAEQFEDQTRDAQLTLGTISIFSQAVPILALRFLLPALDWANILPRLERNRLISRHGDCYDLHPTVREYAYQRMLREGDFIKQSHHKAAEFFAQISKKLDECFNLPDLNSYREEIRHRILAEEYEQAYKLITKIEDCLIACGYYSDIYQIRLKLTGHLCDRNEALNNISLAECLYQGLDMWDEAVTHAEKVRAGYSSHKDEMILAEAIQIQSHILFERGQFKQAFELAEGNLERYKKVGKAVNIANSLNSLGVFNDAMGRWQEAGCYYDQAEELFTEAGMNREVGRVLINHSLTRFFISGADAALDYCDRGIDMCLGDKRPQEFAYGMLNKCIFYIASNRLDEAQSVLDDCQKWAEKESWFALNLKETQSVIFHMQGNSHKALALIDEVLNPFRNLDDNWGEIDCNINKGLFLKGLGMVNEAEKEWQCAFSNAQRKNYYLGSRMCAYLLSKDQVKSYHNPDMIRFGEEFANKLRFCFHNVFMPPYVLFLRSKAVDSHF